MSHEGVVSSLRGFAQNLGVVQSVLIFLCLWLSYQALLIFYRLTLHPLARFPGPRLAGATYWYEYYYDVSKGGRFIWKIMELHKQHGPVVRINPNELHFNDPDFYEEIYHGKKYRTDRDRWYNLDHAGQGLAFTTDHDIHNQRRNALAQHFSMQSIRALEPCITTVVASMMKRLHEARQTGNVIILYHMFAAFAIDIVSEYALGKELSMDFMNSPDYGKAWADLAMTSIPVNNFGRQFKGVMAIMMSLPNFVVKRMNPRVGYFLDWQAVMRSQVKRILDEPVDEIAKDRPTTIFRELINSDLPPEDKTLDRLKDEASMVLGAGGETTAQCLMRTFYHLLNNPSIVERLRDEVRTAIPGAGDMPSLATLQNLPYLNAVVEEGIRISFPVPARNPRVFQDHTLQYGDWVIKPGAAVSMSPWMVSMNEKVFPDPFKFDPERWLGTKELRRYQVSFGKGRRACLGINLAYAEMLFAIAMIVRNFDLELFETTWNDVEIVHDFFMAFPRLDSPGARVKVKTELS